MLSKVCISFCIFAVILAAPQGGNGGGRGGQGGPGGPGGPGHHGPPPPPFLQNVTDDARKAFFDIVSNQNLTQSQVDTQTAAWANTYGVSSIYNEFQQNKTAFETALKNNITTVLGNLANVNSQLEAIFSNKDQTRDQVHTAIEAIKDTYPVEVDTIMFLNHPGPHGPPGGPGGPGGFGGPGGRGGFGGNNASNSTASTKAAKKNKKNSSS